eukprot:1338819-Pleurochrysis_carterae.AAC.1
MSIISNALLVLEFHEGSWSSLTSTYTPWRLKLCISVRAASRHWCSSSLFIACAHVGFSLPCAFSLMARQASASHMS